MSSITMRLGSVERFSSWFGMFLMAVGCLAGYVVVKNGLIYTIREKTITTIRDVLPPPAGIVRLNGAEIQKKMKKDLIDKGLDRKFTVLCPKKIERKVGENFRCILSDNKNRDAGHYLITVVDDKGNLTWTIVEKPLPVESETSPPLL